MAPGGEEGRDKLRKSAGIGKYELIRRYPNGATHRHKAILPGNRGGKPGELKHLSTRRRRKQE